MKQFRIPQGTLDMLILQIVSLEPAHSYGIAQRLSSRFRRRSNPSEPRLSVSRACTGSSKRGWLKAEWKESETGREAKFYALTASGHKQLVTEKDSFGRAWRERFQLIFSEGDQ